MTADEFAKLVRHPKRRSDGEWWDSQCPAHQDRHASLSFADRDAALVVKCHAGCTREAIAHAVGRTVADFRHGAPSARPRHDIVAVYDYEAADGALLYQVVRYAPKDFRCRRPDGAGGWRWSLGNASIVPYRLSTLTKAARVFIPEGEKDVDALVGLGLIATTNHGGGGKWRHEHTCALVAAEVAEVVVLRDNDEVGAKHQRAVATSCARAGLTVKTLDLPDLPGKGDISDWISARRVRGRTNDEIRDALVALAEAAPPFVPSPETEATIKPPPAVRDGDRPEIDTTDLGLDAMAAAAWEAIEVANEPKERVFRYGGALAWLVPNDASGLPTLQLMTQDHVRHHLADVATFTRWTVGMKDRPPKKKAAFPPTALAADLVAVPRPTVPRLTRVVHAPVFARDGRLLAASGYDKETGIYLAPPADLSLPPIPPVPTAENIAAARDLLCTELLGDFPFAADADLANGVAVALTPPLRELVGNVPIAVISKPTPRTGAGLYTKVVSIIHNGAPLAAMTLSRDEDETRKKLTSVLIGSPSMILLDNLHGRLDSAALASILTTGTWRDRVLGHSLTVQLLVRSIFLVTGNNVSLSDEIAGRSVLIRLDAKVEDPSERSSFRHPNLEAWTSTHRARLLWAALVLGQAWFAAGRPRADIAFGGFEEWAAVLGGVLKVAGISGFLGNRRDLFEQADEETAHVRAFLSDWWKTYQGNQVLTNALMDLAKGHPLPISAKNDHGTLVRLGHLIRTLRDRRYNLGDLTVTIRGVGESKRAVLWALVGESTESRESSSVNAREKSGGDVQVENKVVVTEKDSPDSQDSPGEELRL